jgi:SAM-dependent methyltransferase
MRGISTAALLVLAVAMCLVIPRSASPRPAQTPAGVEPDVEFVPTPQAVVDAMLDLARVTASDVVYDLGSGDGRVVITAARRYGARGVGVEIDPALVERATANAAAAGVSGRVRFIRGNIFDADISDATVVTLYLLQSLNEKLRPKLVRELKPDTRIVSHVFSMGPEWPPLQSTVVGGHPVFLWTIAPR